ncbi:MAG: sigma-70 family RNA polymerase sigma factor [Lachnospiraceae bacterium]|nr:sigma-70 family RNA polymerase sigma factor [Lachnospiraceae bacterium]MBD5541954.1 sigma-70 family RNA polymerase sigma factor [Lachnospiraceae bacterium]
MWKRNEGKSELDILQNRFTRYLVTAVKRQRLLYIKNRNTRISQELPFEMQENQLLLMTEPDMLEMLPLMQKLENQGLRSAISGMKERERYIFLERVLSDKSIAELSIELGMEYKSVATVYYRTVEKIRKHMKEAEKNGL